LKILFTPTGRQQFLEAVAYIFRDNPSAKVKDQTVWIIAAWHSAQLPENPESETG
jgi:hypothetical protein